MFGLCRKFFYTGRKEKEFEIRVVRKYENESLWLLIFKGKGHWYRK